MFSTRQGKCRLIVPAAAAFLVSFPACWMPGGKAIAADWKPDKFVEIIVPTSPGSGVDLTGRTVQKILQENKLVETPVSVVNKPGGAYGIGMAYVGQIPGDGHRLMMQTSTPLTAYITGQVKLNYFDFTPIANLISEPIIYLVRPESPIKTAKDLVDRLKADPSSVSIGLAAARGNAFHIASALLARTSGIEITKLKIVVFNSSGEGITSALGGHIDVFAATPANIRAMLEAKKVRVIAVAAPQRMSGPFAVIPTLREQGFDVVFDLWRGVLGGKGLAPAQIQYWDGVFQRFVQTEDWRQALEKNRWANAYKNSEETRKALKAEHDILKSILTELGMVK